MTKRIKTTVGALAAVSALALGGSAIAGAASQQPQKAPKAAVQSSKSESTAPENSATDKDNVQDTTTPDAPGSSGELKGTSGQSKVEAAGSEVANNDGPGGHADEPGNPNADHQAQGVE